MTFTELEKKLRELKVDDIYCNLFNEYHNTSAKARENGLYVTKNNDKWEVYYTERGGSVPVCVFSDECHLYEYVYCYFKKTFDINRLVGGLMRQYPQELIKK